MDVDRTHNEKFLLKLIDARDESFESIGVLVRDIPSKEIREQIEEIFKTLEFKERALIEGYRHDTRQKRD